LIVRRVRLDDAVDLFKAYGASAEATRFLTWAPHSAADGFRDFLEGAVSAWDAGTGFHWVLQRPARPPFGMVSLEPGEHGIEVGYVLSPDSWGHGLMAEGARPPIRWAIEQPSVFRVWATCDCENTASARVLEKLSFAREGTLRRWAVHPNVSDQPRDSYCYSISR
jgi:ribosomal-protein-alanine N-acetyltransferase